MTGLAASAASTSQRQGSQPASRQGFGVKSGGMESDPPPPPTLDYATPGEAPPATPTHPVVGVLGFLIYGALFLLFSTIIGSIIVSTLRWPSGNDLICSMSVFAPLWGLTLWRCVAALRGVFQSRSK
jgi:hypothetical protein